MADLKRLKIADKGTPPATSSPSENLTQPPREVSEPKTRLEFNVPQSVFDEFSEEAAKLFGHKRGSKLAMFNKLWDDYKSRK